MLYRRLEKVQVLINASRQLDKAKPEKKSAVSCIPTSPLKYHLSLPLPPLQAEQARTAAMKDYEGTNRTAQTEVGSHAHTPDTTPTDHTPS